MKLKTIGSLLLSLLTLNACGEPQIVYVYQPMPNYQQQPAGYYGAPQNGYQNQNQMYQNPNQGYQNTQMYQNPNQGYQNNINPNQQMANPNLQRTNPNTAPNQLNSAGTPNNNQLAGLQAPAKPTAQTPVAPKIPAAALTTEQKVLAKARTSFEAIQTLQATVTTFEKDFTGKEGTGQVKMLYKKPGQFKIEVINSPDSGQIGVKLAYSSGSDVKVRPSGGLSFVSVSLGMTDNKLLSGRKYQLNQIDLAATVQRVTTPGLKSKLMGQTQISGGNVILIEVIPQQHFDSKITREVIGIDSSTFLPRIHEMYQGEQKVYGVQVPNITPNAPLPGDAFEV